MKAVFLFIALAFCNFGISQKPDDTMVLIPAGEFIMGKNSTAPSDWQPEHPVKISSFYMDKLEVTNKQYYDFCIATNSPLPQFWGINEFRSGIDFPDYPVVGVSYLIKTYFNIRIINKDWKVEHEFFVFGKLYFIT
jgi:formylglycine-generating enzyme required for sulfatase activity